ncbi:hypothetical protein H6G89_22850 [Oscillatoria sp. FACHB-1407]|uniref:hypothetical protein n=1 Tax=Oscillatoria sp. FACHB-1407 TaxID=2692847 RepID=UPI001689F019|nr:hypothetical protein [Oscillatoria sp. FACHB-1407]MBD2463845.1 hypothetical protein [Oscillatoria sp. FACHB-1407]
MLSWGRVLRFTSRFTLVFPTHAWYECQVTVFATFQSRLLPLLNHVKRFIQTSTTGAQPGIAPS